jgi:hypothetical protein
MASPHVLLFISVRVAAASAVEIYHIVGFQISPCSLKRTPGKPVQKLICDSGDILPTYQEVKEGEKIMYAYDVYWETSEKITWATRWDNYLRMP